MKIEILPTTEQLAVAAAENFIAIAAECIASSGRFTVALTGGSTPRDTYALLATKPYASRVDWSRVHVFWGDERCVPPDSPDSNYGMARDALLAHVPVPEANVHRMRGEAKPERAAAEYESLIDEKVGERFDLIHLGMGANAHICSLFPGSPLLHENEKRVAAQFVKEVAMWRITITPAVINKAARITFIVAGLEKAQAIANVLESPRNPDAFPAQIVQPENGTVLWLIDQAAASLLKQTDT